MRASLLLLGCSLLPALPAQTPPVAAPPPPDLRERIETFRADVADLQQRFDVPQSQERRTRLTARLQQEQRELEALDFDAMPRDARVDWLLLDNHVREQLARLDESARRESEIAPWLTWIEFVTNLREAQQRLEPVAPREAADTVAKLAIEVAATRTNLPKLTTPGDVKGTPLPASRLLRAAEQVEALSDTLRTWFRFQDGYDPSFSWWVKKPFEDATRELAALEERMRELARGSATDTTLVGDPIGADALQRELALEWIPYTPAELVEIAEREFAWCDAEMAKAAAAMGCGDDWRAALERVKQRHREPGEQPKLIADLAHEAIEFLETRDLITIPPLAKDCWRMSMMSPAAQRVNPFFLGGRTIQVSFPTDAMAHIEKLQSLRSNNEHFCRATVHHELIPGHWLQQYSQARHRTYREPFATPFWMEGWALYWEMRMYDLGLAKSPEDKVGMLYWRKHRCARIVFSLSFHLGTWTPARCIEYLIERVGHEPAAAEGEVRRSIGGAYGPLYQAAYMLGGLQLRALHGELVRPGGMTEKAFHDAVLRENSIPIAVLRAALGTGAVTRPLRPWRFVTP